MKKCALLLLAFLTFPSLNAHAQRTPKEAKELVRFYEKSAKEMGISLEQFHREREGYLAWKESLPDPNADYGAHPENYEAIVKKLFSGLLKDPYSAEYSWVVKPTKSYRLPKTHAAFEKLAAHGYAVCVNVNAKNSYGGYTGNSLYWILIFNGAVEDYYEIITAPYMTSIDPKYPRAKLDCAATQEVQP